MDRKEITRLFDQAEAEFTKRIEHTALPLWVVRAFFQREEPSPEELDRAKAMLDTWLETRGLAGEQERFLYAINLGGQALGEAADAHFDNNTSAMVVAYAQLRYAIGYMDGTIQTVADPELPKAIRTESARKAARAKLATDAAKRKAAVVDAVKQEWLRRKRSGVRFSASAFAKEMATRHHHAVTVEHLKNCQTKWAKEFNPAR